MAKGSPPIDLLAYEVDSAREHESVPLIALPNSLQNHPLRADCGEQERNDIVALAVTKLERSAIDGAAASSVNLLPKALPLDRALCLAGATDIGHRQEAEEPEGIGIAEEPARDLRHCCEIGVSDGDGGSRHEVSARDCSDVANQVCKIITNGMEVVLARGAFDSTATPLGGVDVNADLEEAILAHKGDEVVRFI